MRFIVAMWVGMGLISAAWAGVSPLDDLMEDIRTGNEAQVKATIQQSPGLLWQHDDVAKDTPLTMAIKREQVGLVTTMFQAGGSKLCNQQTLLGDYPLHVAVMGGNPEVVSAILKQGCTPNVWSKEWNATPLMLAASLGYEPIVKILLDHHPNVHTQNHFGKNAYDLGVGMNLNPLLLQRLKPTPVKSSLRGYP